jgi:hypothetical protein
MARLHRETSAKVRVRVIVASSHIAPFLLTANLSLAITAVAVMMAIPAVTVMMAADGDHNLGVRRFGERCCENESEQAVQ